tara:strand:+ start:1982 stop:3268 length:1287 start_codon:yes stop_codon:yes gene_type:complete
VNNSYVNEKNYSDKNNLPIFALVAANVCGKDVSNISLAADEYANFIVEQISHLFTNNPKNDCISSAMVCQISEIVTPEYALSAGNIHSYKMRGVDLTSIISKKLLVSVCKSVKCRFISDRGGLTLVSTSEHVNYLENQINSFVHKQLSFNNRRQLVGVICVENSIPLKVIPTLSVVNHLVKFGLKLTIPLSIRYPAKLPDIWKCINQTKPKTSSELDRCLASLAKGVLMTSTFPNLASKSIHFYPQLPANRAVPPLFYIRTGVKGNGSKLGFQVSMTTGRPFVNGSSDVVVFRLNNEYSNDAQRFENKIKFALMQKGITPIERNSDHYSLTYHELAIEILDVVDSHADLLDSVTSFHFSDSLVICSSGGISNLCIPTNINHQNEIAPLNELENCQTISKSTFDWLIKMLSHHSVKFGYKVSLSKIKGK